MATVAATAAPIGQRQLARGYRPSPIEGLMLLALAVVSAFAGYQGYARTTDLNPKAPPAQTFAPAIRNTLTSTVTATGTVQSSQQVSLTFDVGTGGGKIQEFFVRLGDQVKAGQPLAKLDDTDLRQALRSAESAAASAQARLNAANEPPAASEIAAAKQSITTARNQVITAEQNLADLNKPPTSSELLSAQQAVLTAQNQLQTAQDNAAKAQTDYNAATLALQNAKTKQATACANPSGTTDAAKKAACTEAQAALSKAQTEFNTAQSNANNGSLARAIASAQLAVQNAQAKQAELKAGPTLTDIAAGQRAVESAKAAVTVAEARYAEMLEPPKPDVILPLRAAVDQAAANVETARKAVNNATITAPFDGQISQQNGEVGTQVASNTVVFILLNPRLIKIDANVDQAFVGDLRAQQTANVTFDAIQGRSYQGTVNAIGLTPTVQQGVVSYVVSIGLDTSRFPSDAPIPAPGMTASINVTTRRTENALVVPARSVRRIGRNQTVQVKKEDGTIEQRTVTTGVSSGTLIQITSGLTDFEEVLVNTPPANTTPRPSGAAGPVGFGG